MINKILIAASTVPVAGPMDTVWQMVAQSGFNALLVVLLLYYGRQDFKELRKELKEIRKTQDRATRMVTIALLQLASLVPGVKAQLQGIKEEIDESEKEDNRHSEEEP